MSKDLMLDFQSPCGKYVLTFEDDGKVAYAYLKKKKRIVSAVWLYNRCPTPTTVEWSDPKNIPFANCTNYMIEEGRVRRIVRQGDVLVDWERSGCALVAYVYVFEDLYGVLDERDKVGYARFALRDSPLARVMEIEDQNGNQ